MKVATTAFMFFSARFFLWSHELEDNARRAAC